MEFGLMQLWDGGWIGAILRGACVTIAVGVASMIIGLILGTICGLIKWPESSGCHRWSICYLGRAGCRNC